MIDVKQLRYFVKIVEAGSFTKAAAVLHIAQSALSYQISQLEEELGSVLLNRSRAGVSLTETGRVVLGRAQVVLEQLGQIQTDVWSSEVEPTGQVAFSVPPSLARLILPPLIESYRPRFPGVNLLAQEGTRGAMYDRLIQGGIDLAIFYDFSNSPEIETIPLIDDHLCLVGRGEMPRFRSQSHVSVEELAMCPLMLLTPVYGWRRRIDTAFRLRGLTPKISLEIDSLPAMNDLVIRGFGFAILPQAEVQANRRQGLDVWSVRIDDSSLVLTYELAKLKHRRLTRAGVELEKLVMSVVGQLAADGWGRMRLPFQQRAESSGNQG